MSGVGAFPKAVGVASHEDNIAVVGIDRDAFAGAAAVLIEDVEAQRRRAPGCAGVGGIEDIAVGSGIFTDHGVKVVGVFGVDGETENAEFLELGSVTGARRIVADEIEQLGPVGPVVDGLKEAARVGACVDNVGIMGIVEDAIDKPTAGDVDVLPGVGGGEKEPGLEGFEKAGSL